MTEEEADPGESFPHLFVQAGTQIDEIERGERSENQLRQDVTHRLAYTSTTHTHTGAKEQTTLALALIRTPCLTLATRTRTRKGAQTQTRK